MASPARRGLLSPPVLGWVLYDFANTIFSYVVLTRYFNEYVIIERGAPDVYVGAMGFVVSLLLVLSLPFFGGLADRLGRRKPFLIAFTLLSVAATALLGLVGGVLAALLVAGVAIFAFNSAEAHYHPLLASVAPPERQSRVSGLAVGTGYVGVLVALAVIGGLVEEGQNQQAFLPTAALFLVFSIPCFLLVHERRATAGEAPRSSATGGRRAELSRVGREALARVTASVREARGRPHGRFLVARFLYVDAIATVIAFMTVYARRTGEFSATELDLLLALSTVFAVLGAIGAGLLVERVGPKRVLAGTVLAVSVALVVTALTGSGAILWVIGPVVGAALGSVTATDRVLLLRLVRPERRGEVFGLYTLVGKVSNGIGPLVLWGGTIWLVSEGLHLAGPLGASRVALCALAAAALAGLVVLRPLPNPAAGSPSFSG